MQCFAKHLMSENEDRGKDWQSRTLNRSCITTCNDSILDSHNVTSKGRGFTNVAVVFKSIIRLVLQLVNCPQSQACCYIWAEQDHSVANIFPIKLCVDCGMWMACMIRHCCRTRASPEVQKISSNRIYSSENVSLFFFTFAHKALVPSSRLSEWVLQN